VRTQASSSADIPPTSIRLPAGTDDHAQTGTEARPFVPIRRILCPVDFSGWSRAAVERAVALARPTKAEITGLFVLPVVSPIAGEVPSGSCSLEADANMVSALAEDLEAFLRPAQDEGLSVRVCVKRGDCVAQILEQARETDADIIVMGTHGASGLERLVLGSVTRNVLRKAPCPVVTVSLPSVSRTPRTGAAIGRMLCAVELSESSADTVSYALSLGRSTGAEVTLLHVLKRVRGVAARARRAADVRRRLHAAALADGEPGCPVEEMAVFGPPHREIVRMAEARPAGLIVLGNSLRPGSIAARVAREATVPVLTIRHGRERESRRSRGSRVQRVSGQSSPGA